MNTIRHVVFRGRVQGVGFRVFVEDAAVRGRLQGWVRNRRDGTVEALFAGPVGDIDRVIENCRRGPPGARVDAVENHEGDDKDLALREGRETFAVLPTI